jgi:hypothetical protein
MLIQNLSKTENPGEKFYYNNAKLFNKSENYGRKWERERERIGPERIIAALAQRPPSHVPLFP